MRARHCPSWPSASSESAPGSAGSARGRLCPRDRAAFANEGHQRCVEEADACRYEARHACALLWSRKTGLRRCEVQEYSAVLTGHLLCSAPECRPSRLCASQATLSERYGRQAAIAVIRSATPTPRREEGAGTGGGRWSGEGAVAGAYGYGDQPFPPRSPPASSAPTIRLRRTGRSAGGQSAEGRPGTYPLRRGSALDFNEPVPRGPGVWQRPLRRHPGCGGAHCTGSRNSSRLPTGSSAEKRDEITPNSGTSGSRWQPPR